MNKKSTLLALDDVALGMVLSDDLLDSHGGLILPHSSVVTEPMLVSLRRRGIDVLPIVSEECVNLDEEAERERQKVRLAKLFRKCSADQTTEVLFQYVTQYRLGGHS